MAKKQTAKSGGRILKWEEVHFTDRVRGTGFEYGTDYHVEKRADQSEVFVPLSKACKAITR